MSMIIAYNTPNETGTILAADLRHTEFDPEGKETGRYYDIGGKIKNIAGIYLYSIVGMLPSSIYIEDALNKIGTDYKAIPTIQELTKMITILCKKAHENFKNSTHAHMLKEGHQPVFLFLCDVNKFYVFGPSNDFEPIEYSRPGEVSVNLD